MVTSVSLLTLFPHMLFHHQDPTLLNGRVTFHHAKAGSVLARQGDQVLILSNLLSFLPPLPNFVGET